MDPNNASFYPVAHLPESVRCLHLPPAPDLDGRKRRFGGPGLAPTRRVLGELGIRFLEDG